KVDLHSQLFTSLLQNLQKPNPRDAGKAVAVDRDLFIAFHYIDVIPGFKVTGDFRMRSLIGGAQIRERLAGKDHAPAKGIVRPVAFVDVYVVRRVGVLHHDGEVHAGRTTADDIDFHAKTWS